MTMTSLGILLLVVSAGLSAFARARSDGVWSWKMFAKTLAGATLLLVAVIFLAQRLAPFGPEHPLIVTIAITGVIAAGVVALALWCRNKAGV